MPPLTPQLALRVAVIGSIALAMFAIIFFRLWYLQVLSGDQYVKQASTNQIRKLAIPAPRGQIVDRTGNILVDSKPTIAVQLSPPDLPQEPGAAPADVQPPGRNAGHPHQAHPVRDPRLRKAVRLATIPCDVAVEQAKLPYANVTIKTDVQPDVHYFLAERQDQFPGVSVQQVWLRSYPLHETAAQLFGTVGPITQPELSQSHYRGVSQNSIVGQSGLEYYYDRYLRGIDGTDRVQVDALGRFKGYLRQTKPTPGHTLKLSLDLGLQKAGQQALSQAIANNPPAGAGAFVALNPTNGEVLAMGSAPTFDPNIFTKPLSQTQYYAAQQRLQRVSAVQPGDPELVPDRLDVQGDHRHRGAAERRLEPGPDLRRHRRLPERPR